MQSIDQILDPKYQPWGNTGPRKAYYQVCMNEKKKTQFTDATYIYSLTHTRPDMCHVCTNVMFYTSALVYFVLCVLCNTRTTECGRKDAHYAFSFLSFAWIAESDTLEMRSISLYGA